MPSANAKAHDNLITLVSSFLIKNFDLVFWIAEGKEIAFKIQGIHKIFLT